MTDLSRLAEAVEHDEACLWDHVLWGECFHDADGSRIDPHSIVSRRLISPKGTE
jgi:hypothetical protein